MAVLHYHLGLYALASGDLDSAEVELKIVLAFSRGYPAIQIAHSARVRLARIELCRQSQASCLALIRTAEMSTPSTDIILGVQLLRADRCFFMRDLGQAMVHTIICLLLARRISEDSVLAAGLQRLGDLYLMIDEDLLSAAGCYETSMSVMKIVGARRHVADCVLRLGILLLLEGKVAEAKRKCANSRRIYELAENSQGCNYCDAILAECDVEGLKVSLTATLNLPMLIDPFVQSSILIIFPHSHSGLFSGCVSGHINVLAMNESHRTPPPPHTF